MMNSKVALSVLSLFPATPEQVLESRKRTWSQWGGPLTQEEYIERDRLIDAMEHATDSKLITWVLAPRDKPTTLDFICSCETFRRRGLVLYLGSNGRQSNPQEVTCYGIASVYTPPDRRGHGYASHMMRLLHWVLSGRTSEYNLGEFPVEWGAPPAGVKEAGWGLFSVLYSDIGGEFYKNCGPGLAKSGGWETRDPISTMWEVRHEPLTSLNSRDWAWLKHSDLDRLWAKDAAQIKRVIANMPIPTARAIVSFLPDGGVGSSHIFRSMLAAESIISVENWGVVKDDKNTDKPTYATWTVDVRPPPPTLIVTRISATEETFSDLVEAIQHTCRGNGISRMEVWNLPECLMEMAAQMGGKTFQRHEHLPAIKWYGRGNTTDVKWVFNEKFCWC